MSLLILALEDISINYHFLFFIRNCLSERRMAHPHGRLDGSTVQVNSGTFATRPLSSSLPL
jgi:hypothetical protein